MSTKSKRRAKKRRTSTTKRPTRHVIKLIERAEKLEKRAGKRIMAESRAFKETLKALFVTHRKGRKRHSTPAR